MRLCRVHLKWWQRCSLKSAVMMIGSQEAALNLAREVQIGDLRFATILESVILFRPVQEAGGLLRGSGCFRRFGIRICRRFQGRG